MRKYRRFRRVRRAGKSFVGAKKNRPHEAAGFQANAGRDQ
jgi:hypothetical protein